ncbi:MAG: Bifunctional uridylyltransferase/uridylyl-removing enzyme [Candidatus Methanoperedenaceae archaeon GB37]|nr:Bifunctional uridylyltransferase/uridylyl-removing enzyme [Candidatus Methanoperedenaceae archaeon GB37]CAD7779867.1 MAG: Bifunctional uridylyltransferase/uridylyl-removing enzyme [Candidatus Methanoperedenaceae archaeon GB37]
MAGVLSLEGFNIVNAQAHTWKNKIALDTFWVSTKSERERMPQKWKNVEERLYQAIKGEIDLEKLLEAKYYISEVFMKRGLPQVETEIKLDNETSDFYTIVEVYTADRPALLFKLAQCLFKLELNIHIAKISTRLDQVVDVFYIEEKGGGKVRSPQRISLIKYTLKTILKEEKQ